MKTTVEISDALMREARKVAAQQGVTFRTLVERGLNRMITESKEKKPFKLRRRSFRGSGFRPELKNPSWDKIRELIYDDSRE